MTEVLKYQKSLVSNHLEITFMALEGLSWLMLTSWPRCYFSA